MKVVWDTSHLEFTIKDHYYFSSLERLLLEKVDLHIGKHPKDWKNGDIIVFNYPELPFKEEEIKEIINLFENGKRILFLGYYQNEDNVNGVINDVIRNFDISLEPGVVMDSEHNHNNDPLFPKTGKTLAFNQEVSEIVLPCCAPVKGGRPFVLSEKNNEPMAAYLKERGELIVIGSCVFWDNYSIHLLDNRKFAINLLTQELNNTYD